MHNKEHKYEKILVIIWIPVGAIVCYLLTIYTGLGSVLSAGITGVLGSFLPYIKKQTFYFKKLPSAVYCGAFVGMSSVKIMPTIGFIVFGGIFASIFYLLSKNLFLGYGGRLGTIALVGVVVTVLISCILE